MKSSFRSTAPNLQTVNKPAYEPQKLDAFTEGFGEIADNLSEPPARFKKHQIEATGEQLSFGTRTEPLNAGRKPFGRTKSAPRDARLGNQFTPGNPAAAAKRTRPDRSANAVQSKAFGVPGTYTPGAGPSDYKPEAFPPLQNQRGVGQPEEAICVLKVELDNGQNVQLLKVYENDNPDAVVAAFAAKYNISEKAKAKLLQRIYEQIN